MYSHQLSFSQRARHENASPAGPLDPSRCQRRFCRSGSVFQASYVNAYDVPFGRIPRFISTKTSQQSSDNPCRVCIQPALLPPACGTYRRQAIPMGVASVPRSTADQTYASSAGSYRACSDRTQTELNQLVDHITMCGPQIERLELGQCASQRTYPTGTGRRTLSEVRTGRDRASPRIVPSRTRRAVRIQAGKYGSSQVELRGALMNYVIPRAQGREVFAVDVNIEGWPGPGMFPVEATACCFLWCTRPIQDYGARPAKGELIHDTPSSWTFYSSRLSHVSLPIHFRYNVE
ncbi:uncharacterized protein C8Q71DRAFT_61497 [Rhodofomes roseus]|uniref:Uncharacterized protein n=1 Tax=Rhodofomes roseus TaxID=34475 RepID=A0ABQ8KHB5_9APHY|nr:uncharacterized protein C8Q71DRAFT_61497 [Rhodofomes roseus]KAH9836822.1 hypothetical protein C8Q71DRAFT_61497 [Rhodofomes roseus]